MSTGSQPPRPTATPPPPGARTLERRLLGWLLALTVAPALIVLALGGWMLASSLDLTGSLGPWEEVAESGRELVEVVEPQDPAEAEAIARHRDALSRSLTQARRWEFLGERFVRALPWLVLAVAFALVALAYAATRQLARQLAQPIQDVALVAERLGREEPLPPTSGPSIHEVRVLDQTLRRAATELELARERALTAERLRAWGEMARRVAHEMKNPLTPLRFAAHRLERVAPGEDGYDEAVEVVRQEVGRLEELASQFRSLGRPPEGPATEIDLVELLESLLDTDVQVPSSLDIGTGVGPALGHYDALFRAFRNLLRNAVEATATEPDPRVELVVAGAGDGAVEVRIRDNGPGLPPEGAARIFEPDFTTKSRGTGLGLAVVRQAVTADGGTISARSLDRGAEFVVRLPRSVPSDTREESK